MTLPHMHTDRHTQVHAQTHSHTQTLAPPTNIRKNTYETHINTLIGADINTQHTDMHEHRHTNIDTHLTYIYT